LFKELVCVIVYFFLGVGDDFLGGEVNIWDVGFCGCVGLLLF